MSIEDERAGDNTPHPEDYCHKCGRPNISWSVSNELWNEYKGDFNILCPVCFVLQAEADGFILTTWKIAPRMEVARQSPDSAAKGKDD